jgi:hypothetical protein
LFYLFLDRRSVQSFLCFCIFFFFLNFFLVNILDFISLINVNLHNINSIFFKISIGFFFILFSTFFIKEELKYEVRILNIKKIFNFFITILLVGILLNFLKFYFLTKEYTLVFNYCTLGDLRNIWLKSSLDGIQKFTSILSFLFSNFIFFIIFFVYIFKSSLSRKKESLIYIFLAILLISFFFTNFSRQVLINFLTFYFSIITIKFCFTKKFQFSIKDFLLFLLPLLIIFAYTFSYSKCRNLDDTYLFNEVIGLQENYNNKILTEKTFSFKNKLNEKNKFSFYLSPKMIHTFTYLYSGIDNSKILLELNKDYNNQKLHTYYIKNILFSDFDFIFKEKTLTNNNHIYIDNKFPGSTSYIVLAYFDYSLYFYLILLVLFSLGFLILKKVLEKNFFLFSLTLILTLYFLIQSVFFNTPFTINFRHFNFVFIILSLFFSKNLKILKCS